MTSSRNITSSAFASDLQILFRKGTQEELRIPCGSRAEAIQWRSRMHRLRLAMQKENHPDWKLMYRTIVRIDPKDPCVLLVQPVDHEFKQAIAKVIGENPTLIPETTPENDFLKSLLEDKEKP